MNPVFLGTVSAIGWGAADFVARFTSTRIGVIPALAGMLFAGMMGTGLLILPTWSEIPWSVAGITWAIVTGVAALIAYGVFYWALVQGPVTVVSPLVGIFPVFNLLIAVLEGRPPSLQELGTMTIVMAGVFVVCRFGPRAEDGLVQVRGNVILAAVFAALIFAVTVWAGQKSVAEIGDLPTAWVVRLVGFLLLVPLLVKPEGTVDVRGVPPGWWGLIVLQATLDTIGLVAVISAVGPDAEIAIVISSAFTGVTVILARIFLKEPIRTPQWLGIAGIIAGGVLLSSLSIP